jgi:hypothetical protein
MLERFVQFAATPWGSFAVLIVAAFLEVKGDAYFQSGIRSSGMSRIGWFALGTLVLAFYSLFLNSSRINFGKLLGIYVVLFFIVAQAVAKLQFDESPTKPIYVGGACIAVRGLIMTSWRG